MANLKLYFSLKYKVYVDKAFSVFEFVSFAYHGIVLHFPKQFPVSPNTVVYMPLTSLGLYMSKI